MAKINITRSHSLDMSTLKSKIEDVMGAMASKYDLKWSWTGDTEMEVKRSGLNGTVKLDSDKIDINIELGMLLSALKGKIEEGINKELDKHLG